MTGSRSPTVRSLMETTYVTLRADMAITEACGILMDERVTGAPVVDDEDHVIGVLSEKDCLKSLLNGAYDRMPSGLVSDYMTQDVISVDPDIDIYELAERFAGSVHRRFMVVKDDKLIGQVTRRDLLRGIQKYWV